jgi:hypothetical protein
VEELRRQQVDLDKATDTRRRAAEEELTRAQHQAQVMHHCTVVYAVFFFI